MHVTVTSKSPNVGEKYRAYAEKKLQRLARYFNSTRDAHITHREQRGVHSIEVQLDLNGIPLRAEVRAQDIDTATDAVVDKLEEQVRRLKGKLRNRKGKASAPTVAATLSNALADLPEEESTGEAALPTIARTKRFAIKPMFVEEAALQMELLHHDFFAFLDAESDLVSVIYRRRDGNLGLLELEA